MEPGSQVEHEVTFEDKEYNPAVQLVHVVAPGFVPVFVMEPAPHREHKATFEDNEYSPAAQ